MKNFIVVGLILTAVGLSGFVAKDISKKPKPCVSATEKKQIKKYVAENELKGVYTANGVFVSGVKKMPASHPNEKSTITVKYKGYLLDGKVFDETKESSATFPLAQLIKGWQEAFNYLSKGSKSTIIIPSCMAYGAEGAGAAIPPNSIIIFDVELLDFQ